MKKLLNFLLIIYFLFFSLIYSQEIIHNKNKNNINYLFEIKKHRHAIKQICDDDKNEINDILFHVHCRKCGRALVNKYKYPLGIHPHKHCRSLSCPFKINGLSGKMNCTCENQLNNDDIENCNHYIYYFDIYDESDFYYYDDISPIDFLNFIKNYIVEIDTNK